MRFLALGLAAALVGSTALAQTPSTTAPSSSPNTAAPSGTGGSAPASTDTRRSTSAPDAGGARAESRDNRSGTVESRRESTRVGVEVRDRPGVEVNRTRVRTYESQPDIEVRRRRSVRSVEVEENAAPAIRRTYVKRKAAVKRVAKKKRGTRYVVKSRRYIAEPATTVRRRTTIRSYQEPSTTTIRSRSVRTIDRERTGVSVGVGTTTRTNVRREGSTGDVSARRTGAGDATTSRPSGADTSAARSPSTGSGSTAPTSGGTAPASTAPASR